MFIHHELTQDIIDQLKAKGRPTDYLEECLENKRRQAPLADPIVNVHDESLYFWRELDAPPPLPQTYDFYEHWRGPWDNSYIELTELEVEQIQIFGCTIDEDNEFADIVLARQPHLTAYYEKRKAAIKASSIVPTTTVLRNTHSASSASH